ncbi:MFS transporter [Sphaerisporangium sp. NPDC051017]|uniref:MFS transporter n=1 Tax=Sphaerisporangium sp. NPDC051017 TaxID=3154636 RepID=UPI003424EBEB
MSESFQPSRPAVGASVAETDTITPPTSSPEAAVNPRTGKPAGAGHAGVLLAAVSMPVLGAVLLAPSLPTISAAFASTPGADVLAVLILTVPALMIALLASLAGVIADKIGRKRLASAVTQLISGAASYSIRWLARFGVKRLLPTTFGISAVGLLMVWLAGSVPWLVVGAAITAAGAGVFLPTLLTWTLSSLAFHQRGRASGRWTSAVFLGQFASPLVVAGLGTLVGTRPTAMGVLGIVTVIAVVALWASLRRRQVASLL